MSTPSEHENLIAAAVDAAEDIRGPLDGLVEKTATDPSMPFAPDMLERLAALKKDDRAAFEALRAQLKKAGCRVTALDEAIAEENGDTGGRGPTQADILIDLAHLAELFHAQDGAAFADLAPLAPDLPRSMLVPAFYEFARYEDRVMIEWLLQETQDDVRYRLSRVLLGDELKHKFDVVLLDAPPRLTTGTINALCASNHLIIPTIFNALSAETVGNFLRTVEQLLLLDLNPQLKILGILETLSPPINQAKDERASARTTIEEALQRLLPSVTILRSNIPRRNSIAADGLAYLNDKEAEQIFDGLGEEIQSKVNLQFWHSDLKKVASG